MKVNEYIVMSDCITEGAKYGYHRAHKYHDNPSEDVIIAEIESAIMNSICEYFNFDTPNYEDNDDNQVM